MLASPDNGTQARWWSSKEVNHHVGKGHLENRWRIWQVTTPSTILQPGKSGTEKSDSQHDIDTDKRGRVEGGRKIFAVHRSPSKFKVTNFLGLTKVTPHWPITKVRNLHTWLTRTYNKNHSYGRTRTEPRDTQMSPALYSN